MKDIRKALGPVRRKLRCVHLWKGVGYGVLSAGALFLGSTICSFIIPIRDQAGLTGIACSSAVFISALVSLLIPVNDMSCARAADVHGLKERAQTALMITENSPMAELLHSDAIDALAQFDCRCIRFPSIKRHCLIAGAAIILATILCLVPNPQEEVLRSAMAFEKTMEEASTQAQTESEKPMSDLSEKDRQELRKLLAELSREISESEDQMDAMLALGEAEQRLEALRERMAGDAVNQLNDVLNDNGLGALAEAMDSGEEQMMEEALESAEADSLYAASQQVSGDMQNMLGAAARAMQSGDISGAAGSLSQLQSAVQAGNFSQLGSASRLLSSLRSSIGSGGQGGNSGGNGQGNSIGNQPGEGVGNGAGPGSTNQAQEGSGQEQAGRRGNADPRYKEGEYESIYDPTRLDASQTEISAQSPQGEGDSMQAQLGPGAGQIGESVPYNQVIFDYADAAVKAADNQNLTAQERSWVNAYFASLTE